jgi:hypothetical protein
MLLREYGTIKYSHLYPSGLLLLYRLIYNKCSMLKVSITKGYIISHTGQTYEWVVE